MNELIKKLEEEKANNLGKIQYFQTEINKLKEAGKALDKAIKALKNELPK